MYKSEIEDHIISYYHAEQLEAWFMLLWGGICAGLGLWIAVSSEIDFWRGFGFTILPLGVFQMFNGFRNLYLSSGKPESVLHQIQEQTAFTVDLEKKRILNTQIRLHFYRLLEQLLLLLGIGLVLFGSLLNFNPFLVGGGVSLIVQNIILFTQDMLAESRTVRYLNELDLVEFR